MTHGIGRYGTMQAPWWIARIAFDAEKAAWRLALECTRHSRS
jgi:hypothetical protein